MGEKYLQNDVLICHFIAQVNIFFQVYKLALFPLLKMLISFFHEDKVTGS